MDPTNLNATWKSILAVAWIGFNAAVIFFTARYGDPANSLHTSALAWSYVSVAVTLAGLGFPYLLGTITVKPLSAKRTRRTNADA